MTVCRVALPFALQAMFVILQLAEVCGNLSATPFPQPSTPLVKDILGEKDYCQRTSQGSSNMRRSFKEAIESTGLKVSDCQRRFLSWD